MKGMLAAVLVLAPACGGAAAAHPPPAAGPPPAAAAPLATPVAAPGSLSAEVSVAASTGNFVGADDHVVFSLLATGGDLADLVIDLAGGDRWLDHHTILMGTTKRCQILPEAGQVACGPLRSGRTLDVILRAAPTDPGDFSYVARFFDRGPDGALRPVLRTDGGELLATFQETVKPLS